MQSPPFFCYLVPFRSVNLSQDFIFKHSQFMFIYQGCTPVGLDSINNLLHLAKKLFESTVLKQISTELEISLRYQKLGYKLHCQESCMEIGSHCGVFAISDPCDIDFQQVCESSQDHSLICNQCSRIFQLLATSGKK